MKKYEEVVKVIQVELTIVEFNMIYLICDDLKSALIRMARKHVETLMRVLTEKHHNECKKLVDEY